MKKMSIENESPFYGTHHVLYCRYRRKPIRKEHTPMNASLNYSKKDKQRKSMGKEYSVMESDSKRIKIVAAIFLGICVAYLALCGALYVSALLGA